METDRKRAVIVGASSGIGEAVARRLAAQGWGVALVARREEELNRLANELNAQRGAASAVPAARAYVHDVREYECVRALVQRIAQELGGIDAVIYAAGVMPIIAENEYAFDKDRLTLETNVLGAVAWLNEAAQRFERAGTGVIVGISSVAGDRGRRGNPVYGASKAALDSYLESLRNRLGRLGVRVVTVKPGPVDTPMTKALEKKPLLISADKAAESIVRAMQGGSETVYVPGPWRPIMLVIRNLPSFLFKKLNF